MHRHIVYAESREHEKSILLWFRSNHEIFTGEMQEHVVAYLRRNARKLKVSDCSFKFLHPLTLGIVEVHWERLEIDHEFRPTSEEACVAYFMTSEIDYFREWVCEESDSRKAAGIVSARKGVQA